MWDPSQDATEERPTFASGLPVPGLPLAGGHSRGGGSSLAASKKVQRCTRLHTRVTRQDGSTSHTRSRRHPVLHSRGFPRSEETLVLPETRVRVQSSILQDFRARGPGRRPRSQGRVDRGPHPGRRGTTAWDEGHCRCRQPGRVSKASFIGRFRIQRTVGFGPRESKTTHPGKESPALLCWDAGSGKGPGAQ